MDINSKTKQIDDLYDAGASLPTIIRAVGTDEASLRLIGYRVGRAMSTMRREAEWVKTHDENGREVQS